MDIKEIRVKNLTDFVKTQGGAASVSRKYPEIDASYISQLINHHRPFGEKSARRIEDVCKLPSYYFDNFNTDAAQFNIKDFNKYTDKLNEPQRAQMEELLSYFVVLSDENKKLVLNFTQAFYNSDNKLKSMARIRSRSNSLIGEFEDDRPGNSKKA